MQHTRSEEFYSITFGWQEPTTGTGRLWDHEFLLSYPDERIDLIQRTKTYA